MYTSDDRLVLQQALDAVHLHQGCRDDHKKLHACQDQHLRLVMFLPVAEVVLLTEGLLPQFFVLPQLLEDAPDLLSGDFQFVVSQCCRRHEVCCLQSNLHHQGSAVLVVEEQNLVVLEELNLEQFLYINGTEIGLPVAIVVPGRHLNEIVFGGVLGEGDVAAAVVENLNYEGQWPRVCLSGVPFKLDFLLLLDYECEYFVGLEFVDTLDLDHLRSHPIAGLLLVLVDLLLIRLDLFMLHFSIEILVEVFGKLLLLVCSLAIHGLLLSMLCLLLAGADDRNQQDCLDLIQWSHFTEQEIIKMVVNQVRWLRKLARLCCTSSRAWNFFTLYFCSSCLPICYIFSRISFIFQFSDAISCCLSRFACFCISTSLSIACF